MENYEAKSLNGEPSSCGMYPVVGTSRECAPLNPLDKCSSWQTCADNENVMEDLETAPEDEDNDLEKPKYTLRSGWSRKYLTTDNLLSKDFTFWGPNNPTILEEPTGQPILYEVKPPLSSPLFCPTRLPDAFSAIPHLWGREADQRARLQAFVGGDFSDKRFHRLTKYCSARHLRRPSDLSWTTWAGGAGEGEGAGAGSGAGEGWSACERRVLRRRSREVVTYTRWLKYHSHRSSQPPCSDESESDTESRRGPEGEPEREGEPEAEEEVADLVPGRDLVFVFRLYVPFKSKSMGGEQRPRLARVVRLSGRRTVAALRARVACLNDIGLRADVSASPSPVAGPHARALFPGAFLFLSGVIHTDPAGPDLSAGLRAWARPRFGDIPVRHDLAARLDSLPVRLGYPDVVVHQGDCEHLVTLSEVSVFSGALAARAGAGPAARVRRCAACGRRAAAWLVAGGGRLPLDPAPVCVRCLPVYFYTDKRKNADFRLYHFRPGDLAVLGHNH